MELYDNVYWHFDILVLNPTEWKSKYKILSVDGSICFYFYSLVILLHHG